MFRRSLCILLSALILFFSFIQTVAAEESAAVSDPQSGSDGDSETTPEFDSIVPGEDEPEFGDTRVVIPPMIIPPDNITGIDGLGLDVSWNLRYRNGRGNLYTPSYLEFTTKNGVDLTGYAHSVNFDTWYKTNLYYGEYVEFTRDSIISPPEALLSAGANFTIYLDGMISNMQVNYAEYDLPWTTLRPDVYNGADFYVYLYDKLNNEILLDQENIIIKEGDSDNTWDMEIRIRGLDFEIQRIVLYWSYLPTDFWPDLDKYLNNDLYTYTHWFGFSSVSGRIDFLNEDADTGFFYWLEKIFNSIFYLPSLLVDLILDGLSALFVPSQEFLVSFQEKFDTLLSDRFGAVYQSVALVDDLLDGISEADAQDTIHMPSATLDFGDTEFTFGGYDVKVVPDGFGSLVEVCKKAISLVCTIWFVNGLIKRYEELMDR